MSEITELMEMMGYEFTPSHDVQDKAIPGHWAVATLDKILPVTSSPNPGTP